ncbi:hypothetical protein ACNQR7_32475 [Mycolicibacterium senegalense]|uniref:Rv0361 family membrane protein n=1 Tax=Mycolicibacterium senegalense TaxID=1796 RepID=UPI003AAABCA9
MTYPPGPQGQWPPQPDQFGGQQPYGQQPYGNPPQPYGNPPQPDGGYGMVPSPPGSRRKTGMIIGGVAVGLVVVVAAVGFFLRSSGSSDEQAIKNLLEDSGNASGSVSEAKQFLCAADQKMMESIDTSGLGDLGIDIPQPTAVAGGGEVSDVKVDGDKATAAVSAAGATHTIHLRKEEGSWKICMSDDPAMPALP